MTSHTSHPGTHEHGLADGCPRCDEHAQHPFDSLDSDNILTLLERVEANLPARSVNEAQAMMHVRDVRDRSAYCRELLGEA